jgi:hypothetical protein
LQDAIIDKEQVLWTAFTIAAILAALGRLKDYWLEP